MVYEDIFKTQFLPEKILLPQKKKQTFDLCWHSHNTMAKDFEILINLSWIYSRARFSSIELSMHVEHLLKIWL